VINIPLIHVLTASPYKFAYISAKHGLQGFSMVVALEGRAEGRDLEFYLPRLRANCRSSRTR
jgi:hypothetical protein